MASIFTFDPDPPRVSSPWSTPGAATPQATERGGISRQESAQTTSQLGSWPILLKDAGLSKLEPEPQDGSTEYKLHLLLRPRRKFSSTSTGGLVSGSQHSKTVPSISDASFDEESAVSKPASGPSTQTRQARLQQLTTQLLWRLQQSSPFHSSSAGSLVLPLLPEATPTLGVPTRPAKVLPGLEESQGALYEIGVSDDGTLVGLIEEELEESLSNLRAMAASLGCVVETQRRVIVGDCEWIEQGLDGAARKVHAEKLWVAEALVRPDMDSSDQEYSPSSSQIANDLPTNGLKSIEGENLHSSKEQVRVTLAGRSTSGKSSLLGTLTTSILDNGRGKSRLSLLKHRHEIASGVTSSVAQELIGYSVSPEPDLSAVVVNYSSGDVSSWSDIHHLADRLVFLSDSPGLPRYAKSAFRTLVSWDPHWTILCVAADDDQIGRTASVPGSSEPAKFGLNLTPAASDPTDAGKDSALAHLDLCLKLDLPLMVAITKMDIATKSGLRHTLTKLLSRLKGAGRRPVVLSTALAPAIVGGNEMKDLGPDLQHIDFSDDREVDRLVNFQEGVADIVPLVFTSAVTGAGIGKLHALLKSLPSQKAASVQHDSGLLSSFDLNTDHNLPSKLFHVDEVFTIPPSKVYTSSADISAKNHGVVLCGYVNRGTISMGDELNLAPIITEAPSPSGRRSNSLRRSNSYSTRQGRQPASTSMSSEFTRSLQLEVPSTANSPSARSVSSVTVRVVSLRNLRLPVRSLLPGQVGTIGIVPVDVGAPLLRARKGMVLTDSTEIAGYRSFTASFLTSEFASSTSPPLILGGHAMIYINSVRTAVKVTAVALVDNETSEPSSPLDVFDFDSDDENQSYANIGEVQKPENTVLKGHSEVKITFRFVSSVEWMQIGDRVLVVSTASATVATTGSTVPMTALSGFLGRVSDVGS